MREPVRVVCALIVAVFATAGARASAQEDDLVVPAAPPSPPAVAPVTVPPGVEHPPVVPPPAVTPAAPAPAAAPVADPTESVRADVRALREELDAIEAREAASRRFIELWDSARPLASPWDIPGCDGVWVTGYMQSQFETHQDSQDQLAPGGVLLNKDRFLVRRARLRVIGAWRFAEAQIELNGDTTNGPSVNLQKAEASVLYRPDPEKVPVVQATMGLFDTPFGYELVESPRTRPFMERTAMSRAFWAGEPDLGLRLSGGVGFLRWTVAGVNGYPLGTPTYAGQDPISTKDLIVRVGVDTAPRPKLRIAGDVSVLTGTGFHAGTDATKASLQWNDLNEDGIVQATELQGVPAQAATSSQTFSHWAVGADLQASYEDPLGRIMVYGEVTIAQNLDRASFIADPVINGTDVRELGGYAAITQEVMAYGLVGFRFDYYDPNADLFDKRGGALIPSSERIETFSPLVGAVLPHRARLLAQYDVIRNYLARDAEGVPANLRMNTLTLRLQVEL